jgi:TPP-dependent pyruvate/acetoin dehydrogenase alpha subunit
MKIDLSRKVLMNMYRNLVLSRRYEEKLIELFSQGKISGWIHSGIGQEGTGVAVGESLNKEDYLVPYFRSRSSLIAKGINLNELTAEIFGKNTGCCKGRSGEGHIAEPGLGIIGAGGVIGSSIPIGVGLAYAASLEGKKRVVACCFGDGATSRGSFHEAINMASVMNLPIVFVCENNLYAEFSYITIQMKIKDIFKKAEAYGIPGVAVDGCDPIAVYEAMIEAVERARKGKGPSLIETKSYRWRGHFEGDPCEYRPKEELDNWLKKDSLVFYQNSLKKANVIDTKKISEVEREAKNIIEKAIQFAFESPFPSPKEIMEDVYA